MTTNANSAAVITDCDKLKSTVEKLQAIFDDAQPGQGGNVKALCTDITSTMGHAVEIVRNMVTEENQRLGTVCVGCHHV